jgi:PDZ domain-containing protein
MGIVIEPKLVLPVEIRIDTGNIGGPSAGLAFALDIIDELGPTDIDRGERVVATGQIAIDGSVHEIGGVKQKTLGAREAGADVFLVPDGNAATARKYADGLRIVPVSSLDEALHALATR